MAFLLASANRKLSKKEVQPRVYLCYCPGRNFRKIDHRLEILTWALLASTKSLLDPWSLPDLYSALTCVNVLWYRIVDDGEAQIKHAGLLVFPPGARHGFSTMTDISQRLLASSKRRAPERGFYATDSYRRHPICMIRIWRPDCFYRLKLLLRIARE